MSQTQTTQGPTVHSINPVGDDGVVRCFCGHEAVNRISQTAANPNRPYYSCVKPPVDPHQCKFFRWKDQLNLPATPSSSQLHSPRPTAMSVESPSTPTRPTQPHQGSTAKKLTEEQRASRLRAIQSGLTPIKTPASPITSPLKTTIKRNITPPVDTDDFHDMDLSGGFEDEVDVFGTNALNNGPQHKHSSQMNNNSQTSLSGTSEPSPKKFKFMKPVETMSSGMRTPKSSQNAQSSQFEEASAMLPTPPRSSQPSGSGVGVEIHEISSDEDAPRLPTRRLHTRPSIKEAPSTPVHEKKHDFNQDATSPITESMSPYGKTSATNVDNVADALKTLISLDDEIKRRQRPALDVLASLPEEIRRLSRKLAAGEKSLKARDQTNEQLRKELQELKEKNRVLEERISKLEGRR